MAKAKKVVLSIEEKILAHMEDNGQKLKWLADKIEISVGHLHSVLKGKNGVKRNLTDDNRRKINEALNTSF